MSTNSLVTRPSYSSMRTGDAINTPSAAEIYILIGGSGHETSLPISVDHSKKRGGSEQLATMILLLKDVYEYPNRVRVACVAVGNNMTLWEC